MNKNHSITFVLLIFLTLSLCNAVYAQDAPFLEAMKISVGMGEAYFNPSYGDGYATHRLIFGGRFLVFIGTYPKAKVVEIATSSFETQRVVMVTWYISPNIFKLEAGSMRLGTEPDTKRLITSAYARLLCKEFLEYWDEIREPSSNRLREIPKIEF